MFICFLPSTATLSLPTVRAHAHNVQVDSLSMQVDQLQEQLRARIKEIQNIGSDAASSSSELQTALHRAREETEDAIQVRFGRAVCGRVWCWPAQPMSLVLAFGIGEYMMFIRVLICVKCGGGGIVSGCKPDF